MPRRLKFSIRPVVHIKRRRQIRPLVVDDIGRGNLGFGNALLQSTMHAVQCLRHAVSRQRTDIIGPCLLEELGNVGGRNGVTVKARFEALEPEGGQHQQPWDETDEQPRHKQVVNTPKVSTGSRIVTGPQYRLSAVSVRWQP